ncbi:RNA-binding S4 domain-containing protein [Limimaricola pyoseonensis]|uniref:Heat shock protein Hsp15 n=1 Tax=Limimaricola pyoseonensis TaxID=521013 RepID=A0A1G7D316_9RHOB|nr:RNA-binding S4 domain-containing protein [Limimaricola pyoseonensis]SDE45883.1 heat shock protein Hsp15 [Limimaricola pyoseonensis]
MSRTSGNPAEAPRETLRLDKWLWQARFFKTRGLAAALVTKGRVRVNGQPAARPSRGVGPGDVLTFPQGRAIRVIRILALGERRGPASEARGLYDDLDPPVTSAAEEPPGALE